MERLVWMNGNLVKAEEAKISIFDIGRMYGACFYESIRTFKHRLFQLEEHLERLKSSLLYAGILGPDSMERVRKAVDETLEANIGDLAAEDDIWICVEVTPGTGFPMPLVRGDGDKKGEETELTIFAYTNPLPYDEYAHCYTQGKSTITSQFRSPPPHSFEQRCKNRSRLSHFLSKRDAKRVDPEAFALMLDTRGFIAEGTGANIFFVRNEKLYTPTDKNILVGLSRNYVISLAGELKIPVIEKDLTLFDAYTADEAFWTTSSYCILPISMIDDRVIGGPPESGSPPPLPGPITTRLLRAWSESVGVDIVKQAQTLASSSTIKE